MLRNIKINIFIKKTTHFFVAFVVFFIFLSILPLTALAQPDLGINSLSEGGLVLGQTDIRVTIARIVQVFLGLLGMIAVVLIIYSGWLLMTSAGDTQKIISAKKTLINAVIGLAIVLSSFAIAQFIVNSLVRATTQGQFGPSGAPISQPLSGSLGAGIISSHIPMRGGSAPRNTKIAIVFKEAIDAKTLINDTDKNGVLGNVGDEVKKATFKLVKTSILKINNNTFRGIADSDLVTLSGSFAPDKQTFVFSPSGLLGDPANAVSYTAYITPDLKKANGTNAFSSNFAEGYRWEFEVEPRIDNEPPKIISIIPSKGINSRNTVVQLNFSESLDPSSASGNTVDGFQNIILSTNGVLAGSYKISNNFKTVEFVTTDLCGINSCGGNIYCLPANSLVAGIIKATTVGSDPPGAIGPPYDGVVDLAGNSFDGNANNIAEGPLSQSGKSAYNFISGNVATQGDDLAWQFNTSDLIDTSPPVIEIMTPGLDASNINAKASLEVRFSKLMSSYTLNNSNIALTHNVPAPYELWWSVGTDGVDTNGGVPVVGASPVKTNVRINHGTFQPSADPPAIPNYFYPSANSKIQDLTQNCFFPSGGPAIGGGVCIPTASQPYCCNGVRSSSKCSYLP